VASTDRPGAAWHGRYWPVELSCIDWHRLFGADGIGRDYVGVGQVGTVGAVSTVISFVTGVIG
jgi:hypothetical protein